MKLKDRLTVIRERWAPGQRTLGEIEYRDRQHAWSDVRSLLEIIDMLLQEKKNDTHG